MKPQKRNTLTTILIAPIFLFLFCVLPSIAQTREEKLAEAQKLFDEGMELLGKKDVDSYRSAFQKFQKANLICQEISDGSCEIGTLGGLGLSAYKIGDTSTALKNYNAALELSRSLNDKRNQGVILDKIGDVYSNLKQREKAFDYYNQALALLKESGDKESEAITSFNIGLVYEMMGEKHKAIEFYERAILLAGTLGTPKAKLFQIVIIKEVINLYYELGKKQEVINFSKRALALLSEINSKENKLFESRERSQATTFTILLIASIAFDATIDQETKIALFEGLLAYFQSVNNKQGEANMLISIGFITMDARKKIDYLNRALSVYKSIDDKQGEAGTLNWLGRAYQMLGEKQKSLQYFQESILISKSIGDKDGEALSLSFLMSIWKKLGNQQASIFYGKQSVDKFQEVRQQLTSSQPEIQKDYLKRIEPTYRELADILIAEERFPEAQAVLDLLKEEEFSGLLRRSGDAEDNLPYSKAEAAAIAVLERIAALGREKGELEAKNEKGALTGAEKTRLREIVREIETAEAEFNKALAALSGEKNKGQNFDVVVADAQAFMADLKSLGKGTIALYTVVVNDEKPQSENQKEEIKTGWIILVTPEFRKAYPIDVKDLEKTIFAFREALRTDVYNPQTVAQTLYHKLFQQKGKDGKTLEADLDEYFKDKPERTLMWSLDGVLRYVPMAALHDGQTYLVEKYRNTIFNTASKARLKDDAKLNWTALGLGVSEAREESGKTFPQISGAKRELNAIIIENEKDSGILKGTIKIDANFTAEAMQDALLFDKNPVVHIASHFSFNPSDVDSSFLLLGKGKMTVKELTAKSAFFSNVDLLVLSACDTAMGSGNGKEVEGFAYVAQSLGAKAVLASLWQVADTGTDELMIRFYNLRAKNPNTPKGELFRQAQLSLFGAEGKEMKSNISRSDVFKLNGSEIKLPLFIKDDKKPFAHPHYWASFVLIGNWR